MKASQPWHTTPLGIAVRWLGSIQLAVPVLTLVALALAWGTYIESTQDAKLAKAMVYGSWWFMAIMGLVCVSLIFAAISRYPWQRRHVGFLVVHASLVALIAGGFWSLLGRVEGRMALDRGESGSTIEMMDDSLEVVEHSAGTFTPIDSTPAPLRPGRVRVGGLNVEVTEVWDNVAEKVDVTDTGAEPYRAVQIAFGPVEASHLWIGDEAKGEAPVIDGIRIRVLGAGVEWKAPDPSEQQTPGAYVFIVGDQKIPLTQEGQEAFDGWTVTAIKRFSHASVSAGSITNETGKQENPAVDVTITDGKGTIERHTAFDFFPDMVIAKTLQGSARSGARLAPAGRPTLRRGEETIVIYGNPPGMKLAHVSADAKVTLREHTGEFPFVADFGERKLTFLKQYANAKEVSSFTKGPPAKDKRPALVVKLGDSVSPLAWKAQLPVDLGGGRAGLLRFGPKMVELPFTVRLEEFRKTDYPGTEMAMEYESQVNVSAEGQGEQRTVISMNNPLVHSGWKVYQSGFVGTSVSIFSVMRDPGLPLTYLASTMLCIGILITFYGRGLSWGHPGIPLPFAGKESSREALSDRDRVAVAVADPAPESGGVDAGMDAAPGRAADPGRRTSDAVEHVRS